MPPYRGTQAIFAGDLARVFMAVLNGSMNRQIYHAMSAETIPWTDIAAEALRQVGSSTPVPSDTSGPRPFDVSKIKEDFGLEFHSWPKMADYVSYLIENKVD